MSAYCLGGHTASGEPVHDGAVAWGDAPMGSRWRIVEGPAALIGQEFTVLDVSARRFRHRMDRWVASCAEAFAFGIPFVVVEPA